MLITLLGLGLGGQGMEPPVRKNLALAPLIGGIKVRSNKVSLIEFISSFLLVMCHFPEVEPCKTNL